MRHPVSFSSFKRLNYELSADSQLLKSHEKTLESCLVKDKTLQLGFLGKEKYDKYHTLKLIYKRYSRDNRIMIG